MQSGWRERLISHVRVRYTFISTNLKVKQLSIKKFNVYYLSVKKAHMRFFACLEISASSGKHSEFLWSIILLYVPTSESA